MITTVTLNPMLDKTVYVDTLERGRVHRATRLESVAGGKGINVSRQLKQLGLQTVATGFLGGEIGSIVQQLLRQEGIEHDFFKKEKRFEVKLNPPDDFVVKKDSWVLLLI